MHNINYNLLNFSEIYFLKHQTSIYLHKSHPFLKHVFLCKLTVKLE